MGGDHPHLRGPLTEVSASYLPTGSGPGPRAPNTAVTLALTAVIVVGLLAAVVWVTGAPGLLHRTQPDDPRAYAFFRTGPRGGPVTWDPCLHIQLVVNSRSAPPGADALLSEAVARVNEASGLTLEIAGPTTQEPDPDLTARELSRGRPGGVRAPVLVAWTTPEVFPQLGGATAGIGGPVTLLANPLDQAKYVGGSVELDGPQLSGILRHPNGHAEARAVVMHELGHLVGLDHVDSSSQLMAPDGGRVTEFAAGDRAGLALLGSGGCPYDTGASAP